MTDFGTSPNPGATVDAAVLNFLDFTKVLFLYEELQN